MDKWNGQVSVYLTWLDVGLTSRLDRQNKQKQGRLRLPNWARLPPCLQPLLDSWFLDILSSILSRVSKAWLLIEKNCCPTTLEHFLAILLLVAKPHCIQLCITWKPRWVLLNGKHEEVFADMIHSCLCSRQHSDWQKYQWALSVH